MVTLESHDFGSVPIGRFDTGAAVSRADDTAIAQCARFASPAFFHLVRLLPRRRRNAMRALYIFCRDVRDIANDTSSRRLKLALLADWRAQLGLLYAGQPQHLVTRALRDAVERFDLPCADFLGIIDAVEMASRADITGPATEQLELYCERSAVSVIRLALRICGMAAPDVERLAPPLGRALQLASILRDLARDAAKHRLYLPRELMQANGIFATIPGYVLSQPALQRICDALAERAEAQIFTAERAIPRRPQSIALAIRAILASYRALLDQLCARGWARLDEPVHIPVGRRMAFAIGDALIGR